MPNFLARPDGLRLAYELVEGEGPTIVFLPGYASDMSGGKASAVAAWAEREGRAMLRLDYAGCGVSEGVFAEGTIDGWRDDALLLIDRLTAGPLILVGSSMGGWLMLLVALARPDRVKALVGIAAAPDFTEWGFDEQRREILSRDGLLVEEAEDGAPPQVTLRGFWESGQANLLLDIGIPFDGPVRLLHGMGDRVVPVSIALRLGRALRSADVQTILVKNGDHRLSREGDIALLIATVAQLMETQ
ncbi:alpha/beta hydrolase [Sphingomonas oleivorans]|uniref:Palmitoyl-protein thioesterase ABHD10, mitochondrial n=1 Tax=Sphingomonas oleivorans TaxID=1735121 RepID=A0A2T5FX86_9SPHN|nr:alpha/beta hydrolase [Sphingomonas oleivorans]PTQ10728.1 alpha/beta hydrolase [Sphingomonas oleivorans]